jgi:hypothetical protein
VKVHCADIARISQYALDVLHENPKKRRLSENEKTESLRQLSFSHKLGLELVHHFMAPRLTDFGFNPNTASRHAVALTKYVVVLLRLVVCKRGTEK